VPEETRFNLDDKVAIVTGSASGIGKAIATRFAKSGAQVIVSDIQEDTGRETAAELDAEYIGCDISDRHQVRALIDGTVGKFGRLDVMVNNAGINSARKEDRVTIDRYPVDTWHEMINVDLNGTFYCCREASHIMAQQKAGSIINLASIAGVVALRLQIGFVAAKAAIIKMTEAMACELAPMGVRANCISPGSTLTEGTRKLFYGEDGAFREHAERVVSFIPQGRPGEAEEIAAAAAFLASDAASYVNGHNLIVDGGWVCGFNRDF
jgi:3-oxoacyl-[acyl-carrier protein] reductase